MECITEGIRGCIIQGSFEGRPLHAIRGVKPCDFIFTNQDELQTYLDKYTTGLYSANVDVRRYELQPIPNYLQWFKTSQLDYLSPEKRMLPFWPLDDIPSVYLPSRILGLCFSVLQCPSDGRFHSYHGQHHKKFEFKYRTRTRKGKMEITSTLQEHYQIKT